MEAKLAQLEFLIEQTKKLRADLESYGMVKLSDASNVTDSAGLALPATEKNPDIEGTLANEINGLRENTISKSVAFGKENEIQLPFLDSVYIASMIQGMAWDRSRECLIVVFVHSAQYSQYTWYQIICGGENIPELDIRVDPENKKLIFKCGGSGTAILTLKKI